MHLDDETRLFHMRDAAHEAIGFVNGLTVEALHRDRLLALGLVRCLEIVGEAAAGISTEFRLAHPDLPWREMVAMRNRLIHGYFDVDLDRVWDTVTVDLPPLEAKLREIVGT
jgi:uncharacterized protein with HEPN domain